MAVDGVGDNGTVVASDILEMSPIAVWRFVQGDFTEQSVLDELLDLLGDRRADVVISDMAPNMSGMAAVDIPKPWVWWLAATDMAQQVLKPGGVLSQVFRGRGICALLAEMRKSFGRCQQEA